MKASNNYFKKTTLGLSIASIIAFSSIHLASAETSETLSIDLASSAASVSLVQLAKKAGVEIMMNRETETVVLPAIHGNYSLTEALDKLLRGSGLEYEFVSINTIVVKKSTLENPSLNDSKRFALEEIIVTAEKRAESLQDIPIAISAFSGENIERAGVTSIGDLKQLAPSLQFGQSGADTFVSIRSIGAELSNMNAEAGVTIAMDGVPFANQYLFNADFFDVERVEVLRGPQGTISGRNATGGAINFYSKRPTDQFESGLKFTAGNYDRYAAEGYMSGSIIDSKLAGRLAIRTEKASGWLTNTFRNEDQNSTDKMQGRVSLLASLRDDLEALFLLEGSIDRGSKVSNVDLGRARADEPGFAEARQVPGFDMDKLEYQADFPNTQRKVDYKAIAQVTWDLGPSTTVTSTTGYMAQERERSEDFDATIIDSVPFERSDIDTWQVSQELTMTADLTDRLDVIVGGYYLRANAKQPLVLGLLLLDVPLGGHTIDPEQDLTSYAVYTQWRYRLTDNLRLSFGARYTDDRKKMVSERTFNGPLPPVKKSDTWQALTPRLALDYVPTDDFTLYASVSRGFKAGGYTSLFKPVDYDPEFVWNYEAGIKAYWFERLLRTAVTGFYMDYTDLQQSLLITPEDGGTATFQVRNANSATIKGVELEVESHIGEDLKIVIASTWLDATYDKLRTSDQIFPELGERNLDGNRLVRAPRWQFNLSSEYRFPLGNQWLGVLRADYQWQDQIFFTFFNHDLNAQDAYGLLNLSASVEAVDGRWQLSAFARNALDERYVLSSGATPAASPVGEKGRQGQVGAPRTYGVSLSYSF